MTNIRYNKTLMYSFTAIAVALFSVIVISTMYNQPALAQSNANTTSTTDTFRANGLISSLASDTIAGTPNANKSEMWVLGGTWEANVLKGKLTNFVADIEMTQINGKGAHHHTIEKLNNATGMQFFLRSTNASDVMSDQPSTPIALQGNSTMFRGIADITTNGKVQWKDVPVHVAILNGNILNLSIEAAKTNNHFKGLPVFGTVVGIIDQNGKTIISKP